MITLLELFDVTMLPLVDMQTGERIDDKVMLAHKDAKVLTISASRDFDILVNYEKEPEDE